MLMRTDTGGYPIINAAFLPIFWEHVGVSNLVTLLSLAAVAYLVFGPMRKMKRQEKKIKTAVEDLKLIQDLGKDVSSKLEINELLPGIMDAFVKAGKVNKGSIMLYNEETELLEIRAAVGLSDRAREHIKLKIGEGIAGHVAESGQPFLINDTQKNAIYKDFFQSPTQSRPRETILSLPLIVKGRVLGVVTLDSKITGEQFLRNDERLLSILASQAAVSINNAYMYEMAITDGLTKVYIRRHFNLRLEEEVSKARGYDRPLSILFIDIDHFKGFNDTYGHQLGDQALIHLCKILKKRTRSDDIVARYRGEEFIILLPKTPKEQDMLLADRIRKYVERGSFSARGNEYKITVSIGVASYTSNMESGMELIRIADEKLYEAKNAGRNRIAG